MRSYSEANYQAKHLFAFPFFFPRGGALGCLHWQLPVAGDGGSGFVFAWLKCHPVRVRWLGYVSAIRTLVDSQSQIRVANLCRPDESTSIDTVGQPALTYDDQAINS